MPRDALPGVPIQKEGVTANQRTWPFQRALRPEVEARGILLGPRSHGVASRLIEMGGREGGPEAILLVEMGPEVGPGLNQAVGARNLEEILLGLPVSPNCS